MNIVKKIIQSIQNNAHRQTLYHLQNMSDRQLIDCGFSPYLVSEGLKGWPWRTESWTQESSSDEGLLSIEQRHVEQLQNYSDSELADLGIRRGTIKDCVRNGRPGIERTQTDEAA